MKKLSHIALLGALFINTLSIDANIFLDAAQVQVDKITDKKPAHKTSAEFKQAVMRYVKNTDAAAFQNIPLRNADENISYKKELRYLFKNYGKFSVASLLSRLRSAHQEMAKQESDKNSESYQRYEQISSALLLVCAQVFFNETRSQILNALHEIDNLIIYWRYQQNHQIHYFFSKSPIKWVVGKNQEKEISTNINKLERKQAELYILLGAITGHVHSFTEVGLTYKDCYFWIEHLLEIVSCLKISSYNSDDTRFDRIAAELELKLKRINKFATDCMSSIRFAKKPSHFTRNWVIYTTLLAMSGYIIHYNSKNPEIVRSAVTAAHDEVSKFLILLLHPLKKIYERGKLAFSNEPVIEEIKKQIDNEVNKEPVDREAELFKLLDEIIKVGLETESNISEIIKRGNVDLRTSGLDALKEAIEKLKNPKDGFIINSQYEFDEKKILEACDKIKKVIVPIKKNNIVINQEEVKEYDSAMAQVYTFINNFWKATSYNRSGIDIRSDLAVAKIMFMLDDPYLNALEGYTDVIDKNILPLFQLAAQIIENLVIQADGLIKKADDLEIQAAQQLKDHELTLMFTSLIPLAITSLSASKAYKWVTSHDYSPIRIALAEVNSLLIESVRTIDDHNYGKLVYLVSKLRHKTAYLKDSLAGEFMGDVAKLESKQYSAETKRAIVDNMFNKYAFLGKISA